MEAFDELCRRLGVGWRYVDVMGRHVVAPEDVRLAAVQAMGIDLAAPDRAAQHLEEVDDLVGSPPAIAWDGRLPPETLAAGEWRISLDSGGIIDGDPTRPRDVLPFGSHHIEGEGLDEGGVAVLSAPRRNPGSPLVGRHRPWGIVAAVDTLWDDDGERASLQLVGRLADWLEASGGDVVALLPILAPMADEPSPFRPSSRRMWREDLTPETQIPAAPPVPDAWLDAHPDVERFAWFCAAQQRYGPVWRRWPVHVLAASASEAGRASLGLPADAVGDIVGRQYIADREIARLGARLRERDQCLLLDLPVGSHPDGFDCWDHRDDFAFEASLGAPPDDFNADGQVWDLPPLVPFRSRRSGHRLLVECLDHLLSHARLLRLDHVFGIQRQFWCLGSAHDGLYVHWDTEEILAVLQLAAWRHGASLIGENLGTGPEGFDALMDRHRIHPCHVTQFAVLADPSPGSVASLGTHDLPTFAGWWASHDEVRDPLRIAAGLPGSPDDADPDAADLPEAVYRTELERLAISDAALMLISVEDLAGELEPINVPGTSRPENWTRPAERSVDDLVHDARVGDVMRLVEHARRASNDRSSHPNPGWFGDLDRHLLAEGTHRQLGERLGAHLIDLFNRRGAQFTLWWPRADAVSVVGDFNGWSPVAAPLERLVESDVWTGFVAGARSGQFYKYAVRVGGDEFLIADPAAVRREHGGDGASIVWHLDHDWTDDAWMGGRESGRMVQASTRVALAELAAAEAFEQTAVDLVARIVTESADEVTLTLEGSSDWHGLFSVVPRHVTPQQLMFLVDRLHRAGRSVVLEWPGGHLAETVADPGAGPARSVLISSALHRLGTYHLDGLEVPLPTEGSSVLAPDLADELGALVSSIFPGTFVRNAPD